VGFKCIGAIPYYPSQKKKLDYGDPGFSLRSTLQYLGGNIDNFRTELA
jgi:hypothetical protein